MLSVHVQQCKSVFQQQEEVDTLKAGMHLWTECLVSCTTRELVRDNKDESIIDAQQVPVWREREVFWVGCEKMTLGDIKHSMLGHVYRILISHSVW